MVLKSLQTAVENYQMNKNSKEVLSKSGFILFAGITAAGKNTLITKLLETGDFRFVTSHTTRPPRENNGIMEQDGREYWFISEEEMEQKLARNEMIEAKVIYGRQVSGVSLDELKRAISEGKIPMNEIDVQGVEEVRENYPDLKAFFIIPPDFDTWQKRLITRGAMKQDELQARLQTALGEVRHALDNGQYIFVINDDIEATADYVHKIIFGDLDPEHRKERSQQKAKKLLEDLKAHLNS